MKVNSAHFSTLESEHLHQWIDRAEQWEDELCGLPYFLSMILMNKAKKGEDCQALIALFYELPNIMNFCIQGFDVAFIEYMLSSGRNYNLDLEDDLVQIQNYLNERRYDDEYGLRY